MINGKKSLFYTVLMAGALMSCGGPKQAPSEEVAKSGNPVFEGWYADPEGIIYGDTYWIYPTTSDLYEKQTFFEGFGELDQAYRYLGYGRGEMGEDRYVGSFSNQQGR